jgi:hypothetical protein
MHGPVDVKLTKCTLVYCKWLHTKWPPTCFGQPGGHLQVGKLQKMDTLEDKLVKFQNQSKNIVWHISLNQMAAPDVRKAACVFSVLMYTLCLLLPSASRRPVFDSGISKHRSMQYFHDWLSWTRNQSDWWLPVVVLKLWSVSLGMTRDMVVERRWGGGVDFCNGRQDKSIHLCCTWQRTLTQRPVCRSVWWSNSTHQYLREKCHILSGSWRNITLRW